jgi:hypothetical protein
MQSVPEREADKAFRAFLDDLGRLLTTTGMHTHFPELIGITLRSRHPSVEAVPKPTLDQLIASARSVSAEIHAAHL